MHPLTDVASVAHVALHRVEGLRQGRIEAALNRQPFWKARHVINCRHGGSDLLLEFVRTEIARLIEELRQVWTEFVSRRKAPKQRVRSNHFTAFCALEICAIRSEICRRCIRNWINRILRKWYIAQQRHPVVFRDLSSLFTTRKRGSWCLQQCVRVSALHVECQPRLWVCQLAIAAHRNAIKVI